MATQQRNGIPVMLAGYPASLDTVATDEYKNYCPVVKSHKGVVASEDGRCSEIGVSMLRNGGHAVDAAIATTLAIGVVSQMWSGIGGGDFIVIHEAGVRGAVTINARETAPAAATRDMYADKPEAKALGPLSVAVPGKIAGLHVAWKRYGRLPWKTLFQPAIKLARDGFIITQFVAECLRAKENIIMKDPGLRGVYAPRGQLLRAGETCYNVMLADAMNEIANNGPEAFYHGDVGKKLVAELKKSGGIITLDDLKQYKVRIKDALEVNTLGYTIYGMHPPSAGTVCLALILNILQSYGSPNAFKDSLGLHRFIEAMKHNFALRLDLGDPDFVDIKKPVSKMLSPEFAKLIRYRINDRNTFPSEYYLIDRFNPPTEKGTSHLCVVDTERNVVSLTASVNDNLGSGILSPSTGIVLNNHMDDFSIPKEEKKFPFMPPSSPANYISPGKRPLSSMTPIIIFKDNELVGVLGGSGGINITPGVAQVFINHFIHGENPLPAVKHDRVYHRLIPNTVWYEDWYVVTGEHIVLPNDKQEFLRRRRHKLEVLPFLGEKPQGRFDVAAGSFCQLVVQNSQKLLTGVSDIRKGGSPAALK